MKLYEKSSVKRQFLKKVQKHLDLNFEIKKNIYEDEVGSDVIVARAFKKLPEIMRISREIIKKPHKMIQFRPQNFARVPTSSTLAVGNREGG